MWLLRLALARTSLQEVRSPVASMPEPGLGPYLAWALLHGFGPPLGALHVLCGVAAGLASEPEVMAEAARLLSE